MYDVTRCWIISFLTAVALASLGNCHMLTAEEKVSALQFANHLRRSTVPKAADMNGLLWDANLENLAQRAANSCVFAHNYDGDYASLGEVLYRGGSRNLSHILMFMFLERENYNYTTGQCIGTKYPFFATCGHYLQLAYAGVSKIGCGVQLCADGYLAACEFSRKYASPPYQIGEPGTKCGNGYATYYQQGLCYAILYGDPPPIPGPFECKLICLNYGTLIATPFCSCTCQPGFYGVRCEMKNTYYPSTLPNDCLAQAVTCKNGGSPTMFGANCKCVCPANFHGDSCEVNIKQMESSIFLYFGAETIYQSYYPVNVTLWNSSTLRSKVQQSLTAGLNNYCRANAALCCPNSSQAIEAFVEAGNFQDTDNYPSQDVDGTMVAAVHFKLSSLVATQCSSAAAYASKTTLVEAWKTIEAGIKQTAALEAGLQLVRVG